MQKIKKLNQLLYSLILILFDFSFITLLQFFSLYIRANLDLSFLPKFSGINFSDVLWINLIVVLFLYNEKIYHTRLDFWQETKKIYKAVLLAAFLVFTLLVITKISEQYSRVFLLLFFFLLLVCLPILKLILKKYLFNNNFFKVKVLTIGKDKNLEEINREIETNYYLGYKLVKGTDFDLVIINSKDFSSDELSKCINKQLKKTKDIFVIPYVKDINFTDTVVVEYNNLQLSTIKIQNNLKQKKNYYIKRVSDLILSIIVFPFVLFLHLIISLAVILDSKGKVFYKQKRFGKDEKIFECYKYRTMYDDNSEILKEYLLKYPKEKEYYCEFHKYKNDPRITKVGKFLRKYSLDELPQFFNVLKNEMSIIGPRPYSVEEKNKINGNLDTILAIKPGITGYWQVNGRNDLTFYERVELEVWYVKNWSLWIDFVIFLKTFNVLLFKSSR